MSNIVQDFLRRANQQEAEERPVLPFLEFARPALAALALFAMAAASTAQEAQTKPDEQTIEEAYIYLLGRAMVIRQEHMDSGAPGFAYNKISYNPIGSADWVNPNLDTAYLEAWFAVDDASSCAADVAAMASERLLVAMGSVLDCSGRNRCAGKQNAAPAD